MAFERPEDPGRQGPSEVPWRGLHPASLAVNLLPTLWRTLRVTWPLLLAVVAGNGARGLIDLGLVGLLLLAALLRTGIHFATLRYRVSGGRLQIRSGLFSRTDRSIDPARIQNMEIVQNLFHRMAGLVELRLETAGDTGVPGGAEGLLSALSLEDAEALRAELGRGGHHVAASPSPSEAIDRAGLLEVVAYGVSVGRVGAAAIAIGLLLDLTGQVSPEAMQQVVAGGGSRTVLGVMLVALAGGYALSVSNAVVRFFGHRWWRSGDALHIESGLFTRRRMDIPLSKVQLLRVQEPILRRWMGYATLLVETAAVGGVPGAPLPEGTVPMVETEALSDRAREVFPDLDVDLAGSFAGCAPRAVWRATLVGAVRWSLVAAGLLYWTGEGWVLLGVVYGAVIAWLDATRQGWVMSPEYIAVRRGFLRRDTWLLPRNKLQSVRLSQGPLMRNWGLARTSVWFPGGRLSLPDLRESDARDAFERLAGELSRRSTAPPPAR